MTFFKIHQRDNGTNVTVKVSCYSTHEGITWDVSSEVHIGRNYHREHKIYGTATPEEIKDTKLHFVNFIKQSIV